MGWVTGAKLACVRKAIEVVEDGDVVAVGSGTTMAIAVKELSKRVRLEGLRLSIIPTSHQTEILASEHGLTIRSLAEFERLDCAIDGADQVEKESLSLIKGRGAALAREKVVDTLAEKVVIAIHETKLVHRLGRGESIAIETIPFAYPYAMKRMEELGAGVKIRMGKMKVGPVVTDNGNFILDAEFGEILNPRRLEHKIKCVPGVVEVGLFIDVADAVYVGRKDGSVEVLRRRT